MDEAEHDVLAFMTFPKAHWPQIYSTNEDGQVVVLVSLAREMEWKLSALERRRTSTQPASSSRLAALGESSLLLGHAYLRGLEPGSFKAFAASRYANDLHKGAVRACSPLRRRSACAVSIPRVS